MPGKFTGHATRRYESSEMHEVIGGCKICGKRVLTDRSPLVHRTCDACKAEHRRENTRRSNARRKAERHAAKAAMEPPRCEQCGKVIEGANRLIPHRNRLQWARKFCGNTCRQAAFRARNG
jgi:hypothetical protein